MRIVVITYSLTGADLGRKVIIKFREMGYECQGYLFDGYAAQGYVSFHNAKDILKTAFEEKRAVIFICAAGIAVRMIAPFVASKYTDSPVVVMDDMGKYAISLLSGHLGGANELAGLVSKMTGALPVVTTSTDLHDKYAVDLFAKKNNLYYEEKNAAKKFSAAVLNQEKVGFCYDAEWCEMNGNLPQELEIRHYEGLETGVVITPFVKETVFQNHLTLIPRQITLGIGCRRNVPLEEIEAAVLQVLCEHKIHIHAVKQVCSIDLKKDEQGINAFCRKYEIPFVTFSAQELKSVEGSSAHSGFVENVTGVDNVCERSAILGSGGKLIVEKQITGKVTVAAAIEKVRLEING